MKTRKAFFPRMYRYLLPHKKAVTYIFPISTGLSYRFNTKADAIQETIYFCLFCFVVQNVSITEIFKKTEYDGELFLTLSY